MKRSSIDYLHQRAGAQLVDHHGWRLPLCFRSVEEEACQARTSAGLADVSYLLKFDVKQEPPQPGGWRLGANHSLMIGEPPIDAPRGATDVSSVYAGFRLVGPAGRNILGKLTSLNLSGFALENLSCAQTSVAHVLAIVLREDIGSLPAFHLFVSREYGEFVWQAILHAGHEFHLCPIGLGALQAILNGP